MTWIRYTLSGHLETPCNRTCVGELCKMKAKPDSMTRASFFRRVIKDAADYELATTPGFQTNEALWTTCKRLPTDFAPYGDVERGQVTNYEGDCSSGCRWFHVLAGTRGQDWGVCANSESPRAGLLTFEHQGCLYFERDSRDAS